MKARGVGIETRRRLRAEAERRGFGSLHDMMREYYVVQERSLHELAADLLTNTYMIGKVLRECGLEVRGRGGPNHVYLNLTPELLEEIERDGVGAVAARCGVSEMAIYLKLRKLRAQQGGGSEN